MWTDWYLVRIKLNLIKDIGSLNKCFLATKIDNFSFLIESFSIATKKSLIFIYWK